MGSKRDLRRFLFAKPFLDAKLLLREAMLCLDLYGRLALYLISVGGRRFG